jgi:hypothetical protein
MANFGQYYSIMLLFSNQKYLFINKNDKFDCNVFIVFELGNQLIYLKFPVLDSNPVKETVVFMIWGKTIFEKLHLDDF